MSVTLTPGGRSPLEISRDQLVSAELLRDVARSVNAASRMALTHVSTGYGGAGSTLWDDYGADSAGNDPGASIGYTPHPNAATGAGSVTLFEGDIYLDLALNVVVAAWIKLVGTGTWDMTATIGGVSNTVSISAASTTLESTVTCSSVAAGWQRATVTLIRTSGTGECHPRTLRISDELPAALPVPADD